MMQSYWLAAVTQWLVLFFAFFFSLSLSFSLFLFASQFELWEIVEPENYNSEKKNLLE